MVTKKYIGILVVMACVMCSRLYAALPPGPYVDDAQNLALYHLNQSSGTSVTDDTGSGRTAHNGTINSSPSPTWTSGVFGNGLNNADADVCGTTAFNNAVSLLGDSFRVDISMDRNAVSAAYLFNIPAYFFITTGSGGNDLVRAGINTSTGFAVAAADLNGQENWNYVSAVVVSDGSTTSISLYFNGQLAASASGGTLNPASGDQPLYFGAQNNTNNGTAFAGTIDEVRIATFSTDTVVNSYAEANLPAAGTAGRIARVTDDARGLWMDQGTHWFGLNGEIFNVVEFGATGNGITDDANAINAAVNEANAVGGGTVFFPAGTYLVGTAIKMKSNVQYVGTGWASVLKAKAGTQDCILGEAYPSPSTERTNITIRDLQLDGNKSNCTVRDGNDDAYQNAIRWDRVSYSRIINVYIHDTVFNGISIYNASNDNVIAWNRIEDIGKTSATGTECGIFLEAGVCSNKVIHNQIAGTLMYGIWEGGGPAADFYNNLIEGNLISGTTGDGIRVGFDSNSYTIHGTKIRGNTIGGVVDGTSQGIRVYHAGNGMIEDVLVEGNKVSGGAQHGILIANTAVIRPIVIGNHTVDNSGTGLLSSGANSIIAGNISIGNVTQYSDTGTGTVAYGNVFDTNGTVSIPGALTAGASTTDTLTIGSSGTAIAKHLSATRTWDPASINDGVATFTTLTVTGAAVGDTVAVGFSQAVPGKAMLTGAVTAVDTVTVTLFNRTGNPLNLAPGTLRADVWKH